MSFLIDYYNFRILCSGTPTKLRVSIVRCYGSIDEDTEEPKL